MGHTTQRQLLAAGMRCRPLTGVSMWWRLISGFCHSLFCQNGCAVLSLTSWEGWESRKQPLHISWWRGWRTGRYLNIGLWCDHCHNHRRHLSTGILPSPRDKLDKRVSTVRMIHLHYPHNIRQKSHWRNYPQSQASKVDFPSSKQDVMTIMLCWNTITLSKSGYVMYYCIR